uniref:HDC14911 n=1 Tax=Drosophila melanogaster TaxID=7227 RepID=Q6IJH4_DROME|nr:TPA_inf: HDC14911 [Drosophila melanogaster]
MLLLLLFLLLLLLLLLPPVAHIATKKFRNQHFIEVKCNLLPICTINQPMANATKSSQEQVQWQDLVSWAMNEGQARPY